MKKRQYKKGYSRNMVAYYHLSNFVLISERYGLYGHRVLYKHKHTGEIIPNHIIQSLKQIEQQKFWNFIKKIFPTE